MPGGVSGSVQYNDGAGGFGGDAGFTYGGNGQVSIDLGTITTDKKALHISMAFNNAAVDFTPVVIDLLPGTSGANSRAIQVLGNSSEVFGVATNGDIHAGSYTGNIFTSNIAVENSTVTPTVTINSFFDTRGWWGTTTNSGLVFYVNNQNESILIDSASYNVGIYNGPTGATSAPVEQLDVRGNVRTTGVFRAEAQAFASLPGSPVAGMIATINNSTVNAFGAVIAGGGGNTVLGWYNGTNWTVIGV